MLRLPASNLSKGFIESGKSTLAITFPALQIGLLEGVNGSLGDFFLKATPYQKCP